MSNSTILKINITQSNQIQEFKYIEVSDSNPFYINWGDNTPANSYISHTYMTPGIYEIQLSENISYFYFNSNSKNNYLIQIIQLNQMRTYKNMFKNCNYLTTINSNITSLPFKQTKMLLDLTYQSMFENCISLKQCNLNLATQAISFKNMFKNCANLNGVTISFQQLNCLDDIYTIPDTPLTISFTEMFSKCAELIHAFIYLQNYNYKNNYTFPVICDAMFKNCLNLVQVQQQFNIPANTINCNAMFYNCLNLALIPNTLILQNVQTCKEMFYCNITLTSLPAGFTIPSTITDCSYMFFYNYNLKTINDMPIISNNTKTAEYMFYNCNELQYNIQNLFLQDYNIPVSDTDNIDLNLNYMFTFASYISGIFDLSILDIFKNKYPNISASRYIY